MANKMLWANSAHYKRIIEILEDYWLTQPDELAVVVAPVTLAFTGDDFVCALSLLPDFTIAATRKLYVPFARSFTLVDVPETFLSVLYSPLSLSNL